MGKITAIIGSIALAGATPSAQAATVLASGNYSAGQQVSIINGIFLSAGTYDFTLNFTAPPSDVSGGFLSFYNFNYFCNAYDGSGLVYCGGDDSIGINYFSALNTRLYVARVFVQLSGLFPTGGYPQVAVMFDDFCCNYDIGFTASAAGGYVLSYAAVPEPATWALMLLGVGAIGGAMRGRRAKVQYRVSCC